MSIDKKKVIIIVLIIISLIDIYFLTSSAKNKLETVRDSKQEYQDKRLKGFVTLDNMDDIFYVVKDRYSSLSIISALRNDTRYINFILEDILKAESIDEYYISNEEAIKNIFGFTSIDDFKEFYNAIEPLQKLNSYEVIKTSIRASSDKYVFDLKLKGNEEVIIPITVNIKDSKNLKTMSFWNMR